MIFWPVPEKHPSSKLNFSTFSNALSHPQKLTKHFKTHSISLVLENPYPSASALYFLVTFLSLFLNLVTVTAILPLVLAAFVCLLPILFLFLLWPKQAAQVCCLTCCSRISLQKNGTRNFKRFSFYSAKKYKGKGFLSTYKCAF